jgi:acetyl/propionyl-CoA carboxylase alpha subunit
MLRTVLVANRGEIACRVMATLREHGIRSVAVYSDADAQAPHVRAADQAVRIGPAEARLSYLNIEALLGAARESGAEAIHPGYGFLSENAACAEAVEKAGLVFIGPTPGQVRGFGDKRLAREAARKAGVPIVPGYEARSEVSDRQLATEASRLGYPVVVKAALGGGGKGMTIVGSESELLASAPSARRVALAAFGDGSLYLEKLVERPRHVEIQLVGDGRGDAVHFFERECSLQRRHQKVLEETPSPGASASVREDMARAAVALARSVQYRGAGTVEFLLAPDGRFYFLEVNARLQVEHPVSELVTGADLVWWQLCVAAESKLPAPQERVTTRGHAVEVRVYAEDPASDFLPQAGHLARVVWPRLPFVRVDAGVESGAEVAIHYDPILAKIAAWGPDRAAAWQRLATALDQTVVHGAVTNLDFLRGLARDPDLRAGRFDTTTLEAGLIERYRASRAEPAPAMALAAAALAEAPRAKADAGVERRLPGPFDSLGTWGRW